MNKGVIYGIGAYLTWGIIPLYFKQIQAVPADQILAHRIVWSFALLGAIVLFRREWTDLVAAARRSRNLAIYLLAAGLLSVNWLVYIWGVNNGYIVETSLGYFINPLINILLGVFFLKERLRPIQWLPIALAAVGVAYMTISYGRLPWIALTLAFSFGLYGLVKKVSRLSSLNGLTLETGVLFPPAILYLFILEQQGAGAFRHISPQLTVLLMFVGVMTAVPLLLFGAAVQKIPLSLLGLLQYIAPTCQFLIGTLVYGEPFDPIRMVGFGLIWGALVFLWGEGMIERRRFHAGTKPITS